MYRIVRNVNFKPAQFALAQKYSELSDAFADMNDGIVLDDNGEIVAFHERHLRFVQRAAKTPEIAA